MENRLYLFNTTDICLGQLMKSHACLCFIPETKPFHKCKSLYFICTAFKKKITLAIKQDTILWNDLMIGS